MQKIINKIFEAGIHPELDEFEKRSTRLLNRLVFIAVIGTFFLMLVDIYNGYYEVISVFFCVLFFGSIEQVLVRKGYYTAGKMTIFFFILLWGIFFSVVVGNKAGAQYMLLPVAMMPYLIFRSRITAFVLFGITFIAFAITIYLQAHVKPLLELADELVFSYTLIAALMMMLVIFLLTLYSRNLTNDFEKIIMQKNEQLSGAYKDIKDSIIYAKRLQEAILPSDDFIKKHLPESFILYKPKDIVAGDFYWFHATDDGAKIWFAAADCTGHGVPGAMVSVVCSNALNRAVVELGIEEPGKILDKVRELVIDTFEKSREEVKDGMDISLVAIFPTPNSELPTIKWAGANNPLWYISGGKLDEIKPDKQPIGRHVNPKPFTTQVVKINKRDTLFLFTDGFADQFGGPKGKKFKYKQLSELLFNNSKRAPDEQMKILSQAFESWRGDHEQVDDVCVIGIQL